MKTRMLFSMAMLQALLLSAGTVEKTVYFTNFTVETRGAWQTVTFDNTKLCGIPGEPLLPWHEIVLMLPPGESAQSIEVTGEEETNLPGLFQIFPKQNVRPITIGASDKFALNETIYHQDRIYPLKSDCQVETQCMNGYAFALSAITPVRYNPKLKQLSYFRKMTVRITTRQNERQVAALGFLSSSPEVMARAVSFAQNPEMISLYPRKKAPLTSYQYLIISPTLFKNEFQPMINMYDAKGISSRIVTVDSIETYGSGSDLPEKIRNFIIAQHQQYGIMYVLLAGNPPLVPSRGFYCAVLSGGSWFVDDNIPADLYFSGLDGNYDLNANHLYGEVADAADLLPEISVGRFTVNDTVELHRMIHKTVSYQTNPVLGEMNKTLLAGEFLWSSPMTFGSTYMNLLIDEHSDNGYLTHGIPSSTNSINKLYDSLISPPLNIWRYNVSMLLASINRGPLNIHHLGHANYWTMLLLNTSDINNTNFYAVDGIIHNYQVLYTQGCNCGGFDVTGGCIAAKAVTINNFLAGGIFNSRYGWFDEGTSEGPSEHLEREFVSALYNSTTPEKHLGTAHVISKIKTAPWVIVEHEFEPGAQRWCHYDCNVFGDPAMEIWTAEPTVFSAVTWTGSADSNWNNPGNWSPAAVPTTLCDITVPPAPNMPVITTTNATFCHNLTIQGGGNLTINPGKSMVVYGTITLSP